MLGNKRQAMLGKFQAHTFLLLKTVQCSFTLSNLPYRTNECHYLCTYLLKMRTACTAEQNSIVVRLYLTKVLWISYALLAPCHREA